MSQSFLLSAAARTLSLAEVMRMSDDDAFNKFKALRWANNNGEPVCPKCGCVTIYEIRTRCIFKCKGCLVQFSITSGTIFASRKLSIRDYLSAIAIFVNGAKGYSALQLSRDLNCQYKTAFVLAHKLREAIGSDLAKRRLSGSVEIDGAYFGGHVKPKNQKKNRKDQRRAENQTGKRRVVVIMRERAGKSFATVTKSESAAQSTILERVKEGSTVYADEASAWDVLDRWYDARRINHSERYADGPISTNWAESYFSRLRRSEIGIHHHIAGPYLAAYASEMAWREDNRRISNGEQFHAIVRLALKHPVSRQWKGYWQRRAADAA
jgi:hypothetical protein